MKKPFQSYGNSRGVPDYRFRDSNFPIMVQYADEKHPCIVESSDKIRAGVGFEILKLKVLPT